MLPRCLRVAVLTWLTASVLPAQFFVSIDSQPRQQTRATWVGMSGTQHVTVDYGQPRWRPEHERFLEQPTPHRAPVGVGSPTTLTTDVDLAFGQHKLAKGRWYVMAQRGDKDTWALEFFDAAKVDAHKRGENVLFSGPSDVQVPVRLQRATELVERLQITLAESKSTPHNLTLQLAWGPFRIDADVAAAFDARLPEGTPKFAATSDKAVKTGSGLIYEQLTPGTGKPAPAGALLHAHYSGWLADGTMFDNSYVRGEPATLRTDWVVPGLAEALPLMAPGATFRLTMPPELGYGARGMNRIPANSTLVFVITVLGVDGERGR